jgi:flagellar capping protein FliD
MVDDIMKWLIGLAIGVIGFFLKRTFDDIKALQIENTNQQKDLELLKQDSINKYNRLEEKFDLLYSAVNELTKEIKSLNIQLSKKKDI